MDWYERLTDFAKQKIRVVVWVFIGSGILLFPPKKWLAVVHLGHLVDYCGPIIGLAFVFSGILILIDLFIWGKQRVEHRSEQKEKRILLHRLEELYKVKEVKEGFKSQQDCIHWANGVAPLLKFNQQYYVNFIANSHKINLKNISSNLSGSLFNVMVSQVEMAIEELRNDIGLNKDSSSNDTT